MLNINNKISSIRDAIMDNTCSKCKTATVKANRIYNSGKKTDSGEDFDTAVSIWTGISDELIGIIIFFTLIDMISETYKWYKVKDIFI